MLIWLIKSSKDIYKYSEGLKNNWNIGSNVVLTQRITAIIEYLTRTIKTRRIAKIESIE